MYPRNSHNDLDLSNDGSIDFNSSHGSFRYDVFDDVACFGGGRSPLSWLKGWNNDEKKLDSNRNSMENLHSNKEKVQEKSNKFSSENFFSPLFNDSTKLINSTESNCSTPLAGEELKKNNQEDPMVKSNTNVNLMNSKSISNEAKIVAPYVSKISPYSAVEIRLQSSTELVSILCSVDVLKMRSTFFYDLLSEQDHFKIIQRKNSHTPNIIKSINNPQNSKNNDKMNKNDNFLNNDNKMWRPPIILPESSPYEAAALLESLHEGRYVMVVPNPSSINNNCNNIEEFLLNNNNNSSNSTNTTTATVSTAAPISSSLYGNEWCFTWVRLAVAWGMTDLIQSFAYLIDHHFDRVVSILRRWHWRCNPAILNGLKVAVIRKNKFLLPTILTGTIIDPPYASISYSKVRVKFDPNQEINRDGLGSTKMNGSVSIAHIMSFNNQEVKSVMRNRSGIHNLNPSYHSMSTSSLNKSSRSNIKKEKDDFMEDLISEENEDDCFGDISEPFLVQASTKTNNMNGVSMNSSNLSPQWIDPDELFLANYGNQLLNMADKRMFWEMVNVLCEYNEIQIKCHSPLAQFNVLSDTIKRKEFKVLWTQEGVDMMPKKLALEFIKSTLF